ncbi:MAG: glycosyltransferase family 4 protein [Candidatus Thermochlorobacter sp.]
MKLLFLRTDFTGTQRVGGSFSHVKGFLGGLRELGVEVITAATAPIDEHYTFYPIQYNPFYSNLPEIASIAHNQTLKQALPEILAREKPDVIYQRHSEFIYATSQIAAQHRIPLLLEVNGIETWVKKNWGRLTFKRLSLQSEKVQFQSANALFVISEVLKTELLQQFNLPAEKVYVNPNGVDVDKFSDEIDGCAFFKTLSQALQTRWQGKFLCGFVGTFGEWHGVEVLAKAVKPTVEKNPTVHFMLIGDGKLRRTVEDILDEDGVRDYVTMLGLVAHDLVPKYLSLCEVLLSPHVQNADGTVFFGSPTKLFEYMGMGKAIIAAGVGQIADVIEHERNGLIMRHRDHNDLAEKILYLAEHPDLRKRLGKAARKDAVERFSWKENARRVLNVFEHIQRTRCTP